MNKARTGPRSAAKFKPEAHPRNVNQNCNPELHPRSVVQKKNNVVSRRRRTQVIIWSFGRWTQTKVPFSATVIVYRVTPDHIKSLAIPRFCKRTV